MDRFEGDLSTLWRFDVLPSDQETLLVVVVVPYLSRSKKSEKVQTVDGFMVHKRDSFD